LLPATRYKASTCRKDNLIASRIAQGTTATDPRIL
jgi:hypothetical protein